MKTTKWAEVRKAGVKTSDQEKRIKAKKQEMTVQMNLAELRKALGVTQSEIAAAANMGQGEISRVEARNDHLVSTLRRYVEGLGAELEITAVSGKKRIKLLGV